MIDFFCDLDAAGGSVHLPGAGVQLYAEVWKEASCIVQTGIRAVKKDPLPGFAANRSDAFV
jgi:hypothetical protein